MEGPRHILVPLNIAPGAEKPEIVAALAAQVEAVMGSLAPISAPAANVEAMEGTPQ